MHYSRMHTVRSSSRLLEGVSAQGGVCPGEGDGGSARGCVSQHALGQTPPPL